MMMQKQGWLDLVRVCAAVLCCAVLSPLGSCAMVEVRGPSDPPSGAVGAAPGDERGQGALTLEDLVSRVVLFVTPVHGEVDVRFCGLRRVITGNRNEAIVRGEASAARGWAEWCMSERSQIDGWLGSSPELASRVRIWVRQPAGDHNDVSEGDMPADTIRHHLDAHPASRLFEGMGDAYRRHLLEPPGRPALARAWFYVGSPDNDARPSYPRPHFAGLTAEEALARFERDFVVPMNAGERPLIERGEDSGSIVSLGLDKSVPHDEKSGTFLIARTYGSELMYEPLGKRGNPWVSRSEWIGLVLEDTFWDRLGPRSDTAQPSEVRGPIARFISRPMNFTPQEKWHRFCAMVQGRAYVGSGMGGRSVSDEGDSRVYFPVVQMTYIQDAQAGLLRGYNDWRASRGMGPVGREAFATASGLLAAVNEFDGPYEEQAGRVGASRREMRARERDAE
ncbi:MAG: hypothetical protein KF902_10870 [Phycisphaeraceae bacterium]|nr:hypothetical protein [Phycisphaeraceae bacterium]